MPNTYPYTTTAGCGAKTEDAIPGLCSEVENAYKEVMGMIRKKYTETEPPRDGRIPRVGQGEAQKVINTAARLLENIGFAVRRNARSIITSLKGKGKDDVIEATDELCKASYIMRKPYNNINHAMDRFKRKLKDATKQIKEIDKLIKKESEPRQGQIKLSIRQLLLRMKDKAELYKKKMEADEARERELRGEKAEESEEDESDEDESDEDED